MAVALELRRGDLLSLTRANLTEDGILVQIRKTGKALLIQYTLTLEKVLAEPKKLKPQVPRHFLIRNMQGKPYTGNRFASNWQRLMKKAAKNSIEKFSFHDIRSKSASDSDSLQEASERLGHSSTSLTKRTYYRKALPFKPLR